MRIKVCVSHEKDRDFMSGVVETLIRRPYSHILIVYEDLIYHAIPGGITTEPFAEYCKTHDIMGEKEVELYCEPWVFLEHYKFYRGLPYTHLQALAFIPVLGKLFDNDRKRAWCSEFVAWVLNDLGRLWDLAEVDLTTPRLFEVI